MPDETLNLIERYRQGDETAARLLFDRHVGRLISLVRGRLSVRLARRVDAEDVVQSAFRTFFRHAQVGRYDFEQTGDLWRLLVVITLNKLRQSAEYHSAVKRSPDREQPLSPQDSAGAQRDLSGREPTPDAAAAIVEEIDQVTHDLDDTQKQIVELRLQGYEHAEIADQVGRSERTVRRVMDKVKARLKERLSVSE